MAKAKAITKVTPGTSAIVPSYMGEDRTGTEELATHVVPPRLKIVQKQSDSELLSQFMEGDVIMSPQNMLVAAMGKDARGRPVIEDATPFHFVPVFFFEEYCIWNPLELKGQGPAIRERSFDPQGEIARKARDPSTRFKEHPENAGLQIRYVEHLNFVVMLVGETQFAETPMILTFARGEHGNGRKLASLIRMRKAPIYGCVFEAVVGHRQNQMGEWYGLNVANPASVSGWVEKEMFEALVTVHEEFKRLHAEQRVRVDYEPNADEDGDAKADDF